MWTTTITSLTFTRAHRLDIMAGNGSASLQGYISQHKIIREIEYRMLRPTCCHRRLAATGMRSCSPKTR